MYWSYSGYTGSSLYYKPHLLLKKKSLGNINAFAQWPQHLSIANVTFAKYILGAWSTPKYIRRIPDYHSFLDL
jgi:hypothetical protein